MNTKPTKISNVTNGAASTVEAGLPYVATVRITGACELLFHRWDVEGVAAQQRAAKNSKARKTDIIENYVYRNDDGFLCLPGENLRQAVISAARFRQDPRSPRKSAMDLYKAGVVSLTYLASLGMKTWDFEDRRRVVIQRAAVTRIRPAMKPGWEAEIRLMVNLPEYITPADLHDVLNNAGKLIGVGDFRPSFGRFLVTNFKVQ